MVMNDECRYTATGFWSAPTTRGVCIACVVSWTICQFSSISHFIQSWYFIDQSSQYKLTAKIEDKPVVVKSWQTLKCFITDYHLDSQCCTSLEELPEHALLLHPPPPSHTHTYTDVHHFLNRNWWNSRILARGWVMLVSFVCQQACLFFSESVRFSGLLNQTGRFVPGSQPDAHRRRE